MAEYDWTSVIAVSVGIVTLSNLIKRGKNK